MTVIAIHIGGEESGRLEAVSSVRARAGQGLEGDRYFHASGAPPGGALTLIEDEVVESIGLQPGATRRQLTVRGVHLNDLVGAHFMVGAVECYGVKLCEPCLHLQNMTRPGLIRELLHRGGLRADILSDGVIAVGDLVAVQKKDAGSLCAPAGGKTPQVTDVTADRGRYQPPRAATQGEIVIEAPAASPGRRAR